MITMRIELPRDIDERRFAQLRAKLAEYQSRLEGQAGPVYNNDVSRRDSFCKIAVLDHLLKHGSVDAAALREEVSQARLFDERLFVEAFGVIADYVVSGGRYTHGGTGLATEGVVDITEVETPRRKR